MFNITPYIIDISVSQTPQGVNSLNLSNLALFTVDQFLVNPDADAFRAYTSLAAVGTDLGTETETYKQAQAVFSQNRTILDGGGQLIIIPLLSGASGYSGISGVSGLEFEALSQAIQRTQSLVGYYGVISTEYPAPSDMANFATGIQGLQIIAALPSCVYSDVAGAFTTIKSADNFKTRCLYYGQGASALKARLFAAAYMSRLLSVDFTGSNTTLTMHLKQLVGIDADETLTEAQLSAVGVAGVDVYGNFSGTSAVFTSGANLFVDQVYNMTWLKNQLIANGFNCLSANNGKVPQTQAGMNTLLAAYASALAQGVVNGYLAPGVWDSAETFGDSTAFAQNINQRGYYIFANPISSQSKTDRDNRVAPLIQIAAKESGALHESSVIVTVNP